MFKFQISIYFLLVSIFLVYNAVFFNLFSYKQANFDTENNKFEPPVAQNSAIINGRLILVLIDALRYDFIFESNVAKEKLRMPFVNRVIREQKAIPFKLIANPPTVTLPRLKALVSGIIPEFIDILWNFNTTYLAEDNIIRQFNLQNSPVIFYGDDTWLKLFRPNESFVRYEGTTSFMASDYDQVDFNVTRHLAFELEQTDWKVMILHYLGLDHVGHIEGPYAPFNIRRKLHEMDEIIKKIYSNLNRNDLMLVLSDHGMANEGGHGGSSHMEITTPLLLLSKGIFGSKFTYADDQKFNSLIENIKQRKQIDLASTLSCLFGLNVPYHNKGTIFLSDLTEYFDKSLRNYSLEANCLVRNWKQLDRLLDLGQHEIELVRMLDKKSLADAEEFLRIKVESKVKVENIKSEQNKFLILLILIMFMLLFVYAIDQSNSRPFTNPFSCLLALLIFLSKQTFIKKFYILGFALHILSLFSSSFIEEEHQLWYYIGTTQIYLLLFTLFRKNLNQSYRKKIFFNIFCLLIIIRFMRSMNQTGNKWIHLKDIGDFLKECPSKLPLVSLATLALFLVYKFSKSGFKMFNFLILTLIFAFHISANAELLSLYNRNLIAQGCYFTLFLNFAVEIIHFWSSKAANLAKAIQMYEILIKSWIFYNCLVQPTHNLILLACWKVSEHLIEKIFYPNETILIQECSNMIFFYQLIGYICFFSQGNSNSLNTIPISSGLVGINEINEPVIAIVILTSTYSAHIFFYLCSLKSVTIFEAKRLLDKKEEKKIGHKMLMIHANYMIFFDLVILSFYSLNAFLQKEHLFVWSVFAPKLIYLLGSVLIKFLFIVVQLIIMKILNF